MVQPERRIVFDAVQKAAYPKSPYPLRCSSMETPRDLIAGPIQGIVLSTDLLDGVIFPDNVQEAQALVDEIEALIRQLNITGYHWPWKNAGSLGCTLLAVRNQLIAIQKRVILSEHVSELRSRLASHLHARTLH